MSTAVDVETIPFALPDIDATDIEAVSAVMARGWLTTGGECARFEQALLKALDGQRVEGVAVNSATAALHLALEALGVTAGSEVIVPTWTFTSTAEVVRYLGATPVFVDVEPGTLLMPRRAVEQAISERTRAIMPVNFAGVSPSYDWLQEVIGQRPITVILDAAHNVPDASVGTQLAENVDAACFSFYATKAMTTGEGGFLATRHARVASRAKTMRLHGIDRDVFDRYTAASRSSDYDVVAPGYKYNLTDTAAALGLSQLRRAESMRRRRAEIAARYLEAIRREPVEGVDHDMADPSHACHLFPVCLPPGFTKSTAQVRRSMREAGVVTSMHFKPLHHFSYWRGFVRSESAFPTADSYARRTFSLPLFSKMTDHQVTRTVDALKAALRD